MAERHSERAGSEVALGILSARETRHLQQDSPIPEKRSDRRIHGGAVSVAIYDDRLEIESAGLLPLGLTVLDLKRKRPSKPRNPLLANLFYLRGLIERWGSDTQRLVKLCVKAGHPEPQFREAAGSVTVTFPIAGYSPPHRIEHDLTDRQRRILHILGDGRRTAREVTSD